MYSPHKRSFSFKANLFEFTITDLKVKRKQCRQCFTKKWRSDPQSLPTVSDMVSCLSTCQKLKYIYMSRLSHRKVITSSQSSRRLQLLHRPYKKPTRVISGNCLLQLEKYQRVINDCNARPDNIVNVQQHLFPSLCLRSKQEDDVAYVAPRTRGIFPEISR